MVGPGETDLRSEPLHAVVDPGSCDRRGAPGLQRFGERGQRLGRKPDQQDPGLGEFAAARIGAPRLLLQRDLEPERASQPDCAFQSDVATHEADKLLGDRGAKARSAKPPGGRLIGLREALEDALLRVRRDADAGVADRKLQIDTAVGFPLRGHVQGHAAALGEFHRVAREVDEYLAQVVRIAAQRRRHLGHDRHHELDLFRRRLRRDDPGGAVHQGVQIEIGLLEGQLARFDLREVEHILDQPQHHPRCAAQCLQHVGLLPVKRRVAQQVRHADDRVERRPHLVAHHRNEAPLGEVGGFGARKRVEHALDQRQDIEAERNQSEQEPDAFVDMRTPECARGKDRGKAGHTESERQEQVARPEAKAVRQRDPDIDQKERQRALFEVGHRPGDHPEVPDQRDEPAQLRNPVGGQRGNQDPGREREIDQVDEHVHAQDAAVREILDIDEVEAENRRHQHPHEGLLVLGVGTRSELVAQGLQHRRHRFQAGSLLTAWSPSSRWIRATSPATPRKASTRCVSK